MQKHSNDNGGVETMLAGLVFSLTFSSIVIAFLLFNAYGYQVTGDESTLSYIGGSSFSGIQDYTTNTITDNANYIQTGIGAGTYVYVAGIGRELQNNNLGLEPKIMLRGVQASNGTYNIVYKVNNTVKADFTVYARYNGAGAILNIPIKITTDAVQILNFHEGSVRTSATVAGANTKTYVKITTQFNEPAGSLSVYYDDTLVLSESGYIGEGNYYYAGIMSKQNGFIVESINAGAIDLSANADVFSQVSSFLEILAAIVIWNVNPAFLPWELNLIFIKTQVFAIGACIVIIIRG